MKTMKRILLVTMAAILMLSMLPISALAVDTTTDVDWIAIGSAEEFRKIGTDTATYPASGNYYLTSDIDFSDANGDPVSVQYLVTNQFTGVLEGNNKVLKGFKLNAANGHSGVFADLGAGCTIRNLQIGEATAAIEANIPATTAERNVGFLSPIGRNRNIIENVHIYGECKVASTGKTRVGGFVGYGRELSVMNSSFTGSITVSSTSTAEKNFAGIVGLLEHSNSNRGTVVKNCDVNVVITPNYSSGGSSTRAAGIVGYCGMTMLVDECTVNCTINGGNENGGVVGNAGNNAALLVVTDCALTGNTNVYGTATSRLYVRGCAAQNTEARDFAVVGNDGFADFGSGFDPAKSYVWLINDKSDFANIGKTVKYKDAAGAEQSYTYSTTGFYRLSNDIVMNDSAYTDAIVNQVFGGVLDGNGYAIKNLTLNDNTGDAGFFKGIAHSTGGNDTVITDISFGSADSYVSMTTGMLTSGVISGYAGHSTNNYSVIFNGVDVYANVNHTGAKVSFGGFVGLSRRVSYYDCNTYGAISSNRSAAIDSYINLGGFAATAETDNVVFFNCNNYADISVNNTNADNSGSKTARAAGFVTYTVRKLSFVGCNNFGDITVESTADIVINEAAGLVACSEGTSTEVVVDCANFGSISSTDYAGGAFGYNKHPVTLDGFGQFGTVSGATTNNLVVPNGTVKVSNYNETVEAAVTMVQGASIRLSSDTGIRFKGVISDSAYDRLVAVYGEDAVSYGVLIAPMAFVNAAGGTLTHAALDEYAEKNNFGADEKAYIDVVAEEWFNGEKGIVAGSIVKLPVSLYNAGFTGVAYVSVTVDGNTFTIYASNAQTRSIKYVANAALNDLLYKKADGSLWALVDGQYVAYDGEDAASYVYVVADGGEYDTVSCYSEAQRATLQGIVTPAN